MFGLSLYGIGALCMWPAGLNQSFGGFCGATFVIGSGLGSLETAANPYLTGMFQSSIRVFSTHHAIVYIDCHAVCGPPRYSEIRINFAQSFNAVGTVVGPVLGSYAFFTGESDTVAALQRVQWVYLAIGLFVFCLAGIFFVSNIPEVTDEDMAFQVSTTHVDEQDKPFWKQWKLFHATLAQFTYTGAQGMSSDTVFFNLPFVYLTLTALQSPSPATSLITLSTPGPVATAPKAQSCWPVPRVPLQWAGSSAPVS